jgi:hypothetical protein
MISKVRCTSIASYSSDILSFNLRTCNPKENANVDKRTTGIVATVVSVLLCGCPGLLVLCSGMMLAIVSRVPDADIDIGGRNDPGAALSMGLGLLCLGMLLVAIPVVVGLLTLRNRSEPAVSIYTPPASTPPPASGGGPSIYTPPASTPPPASGGEASVYTPPASSPPDDITLTSSTPSDEELPPTS